MAACGLTLRERLLRHWRWKVTMLAGSMVLLLGVYLLLQRIRLFDPRTLPLTRVDQWADFSPAWIWVYVLQYVQVPIAPLLATSRDEIRRFLVGFIGVAMVSFIVFLLYPVEGPWPSPGQRDAANWIYHLLITIDRPIRPCRGFDPRPNIDCCLQEIEVRRSRPPLAGRWCTG